MYNFDVTIFGKTYTCLEVGNVMQRAHHTQNPFLCLMQLQFQLELLEVVIRKARFAG
jgi:hypothetical protein